MKCRFALTVLAMLALGAVFGTAQTPPWFEGCGWLVYGTECLLFGADSGGRWLLDEDDGFAADDYVLMSGWLDPC